MERRGQETTKDSRGTARSYFWLDREKSGPVHCTRCDAGMSRTDYAGKNILKETLLWICPVCEPVLDGVPLAAIEAKKEGFLD